MNGVMSNAWWVLAVRGVLGIVFGALALMWPVLTLLVLVALFAAYALLSGIAAVVGAWRARAAGPGRGETWMIVVLGLVAIACGVVAVVWPAITALALVLIMGVNALVAGVLDIAVAIRHRDTVKHTWLMVLAGVVSIVFGVGVLVFPGAGALALVWMISIYAIASGVLLLAMGIQARRGQGPYGHAPA
ncbi:HdeD family acid-resistance protein [Bordetella bronchialis]|uniref:HdeD family acid-resistance protein n=1 Tax=Bordetella bronchialis TaxID=463025 RepID=A0A193FD70_9BORD|nr:DUF308 domain-containing protein [Bordetella bronchialis]ANN65490.1 hypothetical protein BAU06_03540 [Bordetella bronchialis]ANN70520.1 hypothetical protein BAU08_03505 [Bordetella bronchialis]